MQGSQSRRLAGLPLPNVWERVVDVVVDPLNQTVNIGLSAWSAQGVRLMSAETSEFVGDQTATKPKRFLAF